MLAAAPAASAATCVAYAAKAIRAGWIRFTHLSLNNPPVDVYLYSFGDPKAIIVLKHVGYGNFSQYMKVYGPTPDPEPRLITCSGTFDPALGSYLSNVVVYAAQIR